MEYRVIFHPKAEAEFRQLYDDMAARASLAIAWNFIVGIRDHIAWVCRLFHSAAQSGSGHVWPVRIIGYRRAVSIPAVEGEQVLILGIFFRRLEHHRGRPTLLRLEAAVDTPRGRAGDFQALWHEPAAEGRGASAGVIGGGTPLTISAKPTHEFQPCGYAHEKSKKLRKLLLTVLLGGDYIRLTNEGGAPLAAKQFASE